MIDTVGLKVISLEDQDPDGKAVPLNEIDPFTFLASFNRGITDENRHQNWVFLVSRWNLGSPVPEDFAGIPLMFNMNSWFFPYAKDRAKNHIQELWTIAGQGANGRADQIDGDLFNRCVDLLRMNVNRLTIGLFWINPEGFLPADNKTTAYGEAKGIMTKPEDYQSYRQWLKEMNEKVGENYPQMSQAAHLFAVQGKGWSFTKWMGPLLDALRALGGSGTPKTVLQKIQETLNLSHEIFSDKSKSGQPKFYNEVAWARKYLLWEE